MSSEDLEWLKKKNTDIIVKRTIRWLGVGPEGGTEKKEREFGFRLLPGNAADEIEAATYVKDENGEDDISISGGKRELLKLTLSYSTQEIDLLYRNQPLNLIRALEVVAADLNGIGSEVEITEAKNEEGGDSGTSDTASSPSAETSA